MTDAERRRSTDKTKIDWEQVRQRAAAHFIDVPDVVRVTENGNQEWLYLSHQAGVDENGLYERVTEGPAEGERVYFE